MYQAVKVQSFYARKRLPKHCHGDACGDFQGNYISVIRAFPLFSFSLLQIFRALENSHTRFHFPPKTSAFLRTSRKIIAIATSVVVSLPSSSHKHSIMNRMLILDLVSRVWSIPMPARNQDTSPGLFRSTELLHPTLVLIPTVEPHRGTTLFHVNP